MPGWWNLVDTGDLKSPGHCDRAGSSPAPGTITFKLSSADGSFLSTLVEYINWSHRQVGKAVDCKSAIHQFESGWLLQKNKLYYKFKYLLKSMSGDVRVVECAGFEIR